MISGLAVENLKVGWATLWELKVRLLLNQFGEFPGLDQGHINVYVLLVGWN
jgi:hypothetical protein